MIARQESAPARRDNLQIRNPRCNPKRRTPLSLPPLRSSAASVVIRPGRDLGARARNRLPERTVRMASLYAPISMLSRQSSASSKKSPRSPTASRPPHSPLVVRSQADVVSAGAAFQACYVAMHTSCAGVWCWLSGWTRCNVSATATTWPSRIASASNADVAGTLDDASAAALGQELLFLGA